MIEMKKDSLNKQNKGGTKMELCAEKIGSFIQNCRKEIGLTQAEMAERLLITPQSVSNWERGVSHS